jgi:hypothetical protein
MRTRGRDLVLESRDPNLGQGCSGPNLDRYIVAGGARTAATENSIEHLTVRPSPLPATDRSYEKKTGRREPPCFSSYHSLVSQVFVVADAATAGRARSE